VEGELKIMAVMKQAESMLQRMNSYVASMIESKVEKTQRRKL